IAGRAINVDQTLSPYGAGWGIAGVSRLVPVCHGVVWVFGNGDWRYYATDNDHVGEYVNPPEDWGRLVQNLNGSWTYFARDKSVIDFDATGLQVDVADAHGMATTYTYTADGELATVDTIDGGHPVISGSPIIE